VPWDGSDANKVAERRAEVLRDNEKAANIHINGNDENVDDGGAPMDRHAPERRDVAAKPAHGLGVWLGKLLL
jgi:hypothetical protein